MCKSLSFCSIFGRTINLRFPQWFYQLIESFCQIINNTATDNSSYSNNNIYNNYTDHDDDDFQSI